MNQEKRDRILALRLADRIDEKNEAVRNLFEAWRRGKFRELLVENLWHSSKPIYGPPDQYPRLRCYRGQGPKVELRQAVKCACGNCPPDHYHLGIDADYVHESVSQMEESEGCPGAPIKKEFIWLSVPRSLLQNPTEKTFKAWAKTVRDKLYEIDRAAAIETVSRLKKKFDL